MPLVTIPGRYTATAKDAQIGESSKGTPFLQITFDTDEGSTITDWVYLSKKAIDRAVKTLEKAFEFDGNFETIEAQVRGKQCSIVCDEEENDKGDLVMRVKWINPLGGGVKQINGEQSWRQQMTARFAKGKKPAQQPAPAGSVDTEEDVPF